MCYEILKFYKEFLVFTVGRFTFPIWKKNIILTNKFALLLSLKS